MAVVVAVVATACATTARRAVEDVVEHETEGAFYDVPHPLPPGAPGDLIKVKRLLGAPNGARAWRVLYHSRDLRDRDIAVSGVVVAPNGAAPSGGRPVVGWGHPTTGTAPRCAPSVGFDPFDLIEGLRGFLDEGYVVAATDYSGLGAAGPPSYLLGTTEGNNVLDSVRAARHIADAHAGTRLLLWGHSQGGQAALFAGQDAPRYAPELQLEAVAVAAPAAELGDLLRDDIVDVSGVSLGAYAFDAYPRAYDVADPEAARAVILTPAGVLATPKMAQLCLLGQNRRLHAIAGPLVGRFITHEPGSVEPWRSWLEENTPGAERIGVPILVAQGDADDLVHPATTTRYVRQLCASGELVRYRRYEDIDHALVALRALPLVRQWFDDALAHRRVGTTCRS